MDEINKNSSEGNYGLVSISTPVLLLSMVPLLIMAMISNLMQLQIASSIGIGCIRTFVQLTILGVILRPIFEWGEHHPLIVIGYCGFMVLLASLESCRRSKYYFKGQFTGILCSLAVNVLIVSLFTFCIIIRPRPLWNPQYAIPIVGMLLGNCINGISLSLDAATKSLVEQRREIELYLSFGANSYEAVGRLLRETVRTGAMPIINTMTVIGIISIPGMMTGQILGGAPVMEAARYQVLIIYLIAVCTFGVILMQSWIVMRVGFDSFSILHTDLFIKRQKVSLGQYISSLFRFQRYTNVKETEPFLKHFPQSGTLEIKSPSQDCAKTPLLKVHDLSQTYGVRTLFKNISFEVKPGEVMFVCGPSGVGKSQLLRIIAQLNPLRHGSMSLHGQKNSSATATSWRRKIRYITQSKIDIPGTPKDFIHHIASFASWKNDDSEGIPTISDMISETGDLLQNWGMPSDSLTKEWTVLSGGEAQRVIVAIAIATKPQILLFDESTSALDDLNKISLERCVVNYITQNNVGVLWISHDAEQLERMSTAVC